MINSTSIANRWRLLLAATLLPTLAALMPTAAWSQPPIPPYVPNRHQFHQLPTTPGRIGTEQMFRVPNSAGYYQPVELRGPKGSLVSMAAEGGFLPDRKGKIKAGLLMGQVYRFRIGNVKLLEGYEVFPTVEVINRLNPPPGMAAKFPIPVEVTSEEVEMAIRGHMITRVIYLEDPNQALGVAEGDSQRHFDVGYRVDPLEIADRMGRPMAILRLGSRVPLGMDDVEFKLGHTPSVVYPEEAAPAIRTVPQAPAPQAPAPAPLPTAPSNDLRGTQQTGYAPSPTRRSNAGAHSLQPAAPRLPYRYELHDRPAR